MRQLSFLTPSPRINKAVNVSSVPQRSPFRYPGGKTWLVPTIRLWMSQYDSPPKEFIEPFAGGAIIGLTVAMEGWARHVVLVELDDGVAAVWETILGGGATWLAEQIVAFDPTPENVDALLQQKAGSREQLAFQTIVRNRVSHGGIMAPGAGRIKHGENGRGLRSRWYPQTLKKRILQIASYKDKITFIHGDGLAVMEQYLAQPNTVFFLDPPYTVAGKKAGRRLYTHHHIDHEHLFELAARTDDFLMTYDHCPAVIAMARKHHFEFQAIPMQTTHHRQIYELLIAKDLGWLR